MKDLMCPYCKGRMEHKSTSWKITSKQKDECEIRADVIYECEDCGGTFRIRIVKEVKL